MKNTIIEMKNTLQGIHSGGDEAEDQIRDLEYKEAKQTNKQVIRIPKKKKSPKT